MRNLRVFLGMIVITFNIAYGSELNCISLEKINGWDGSPTFDHLKIKSKVVGGRLKNPTVDGAFGADYMGFLTGKTSVNNKWIRFAGIEDAWCLFTVVVPVNFQKKINSFTGFVNKICEDETGGNSFKLKCTIRP